MRHDDHPAARLIIHRPLNRVEGERLALDPLLVSLPLDRKLAPLLAVDLDDIGDISRSDEAAVGDRPRALRHEGLVAKRLPAFFGQMRHHRRETMDKTIARLGESGAQIVRDRRLADRADRRAKFVG